MNTTIDFNLLINNDNEFNNENLIDNDSEDNIINNIIINKNDTYETIINLLGLNIKINYPLKNIINGLIEMHMINNSKGNHSNYSKTYVFRTDPVSTQIKNVLFSNYLTHFSYRIINHYLIRAHRHYKYNKIMNINEPRRESKMEVYGFNNDNPRWSPLESLYL